VAVVQATGVRTRAASRRRISLLLNGISGLRSAVGPLFGLLGAGGGEVGGGEHREGGVGVPGPVAADLVVIESGFVLRGLGWVGRAARCLLGRPFS
jgi:hypothetical protein